MNFKKLISLFLAVLMLCGALTSLSVVTASAAESTSESETTTPGTGSVVESEEDRMKRYQTTVYANPEQKLAAMKLMSEKGHFAIYADEDSGEVAVKNTITGQTLFTNPYDIGAATSTANVKNRLLSQIIVQFKEVESDNKKTYTSFEYAAAKDQIKVKNIKNGIRVEYTIGREEARMLVPRQIEKVRFETLIQAPMEEYYGMTAAEAKRIFADNEYDNPLFATAFEFNKRLSYFVYKDLDECSSDRLKQDLLDAFPIVEKMDIYVLDPAAATIEIGRIEETIKAACPNYSYEEMDYDHQMTEYTSEEENPPLFKMALEYTIDETGFSVRLPANGIRFNESKFELLSLQVLPYMGAGNNAYDGYAFFPDGSGALFAFEDMKASNNETITAKIYGEDYAYHKLDMEYQQVVRYPVYGIVEDTRYYDCIYINESTGEEERVTVSGVIYDAVMKAVEDGTTTSSAIYKDYGTYILQGEVTPRVEKRGFSAVIEEGDALTSLSYVHEGTQAPYDTVSMICSPRPRDEYNLADAISVGDNKTVSVVCERKYVGSYKVHFTMLSDETLAEKAVEEGKMEEGDWYEASWLGMAISYRDRLADKGYLTAPDSSVSTDDIPLYIESFGAMETIEKILSIPVEVKRPLTSAQDVLTMYDQLSSGKVEGDDGEIIQRAQIKNINFKLTGYANGGMYATVPYGLKWEKAVSEEVSMQELFDKAAEINASGDGHLGLFPDADFSYVTTTKFADGFSMRNHAVRTIDDCYSYKREYMATQQRYAGYFQLAISPAYFSRFYTKYMENYLAYENVTGISVGSLGNALNSDFDEDDPYNREDAKSFVTKALSFISGSNDGQLEVMVDGGNAYTWQYVDHILDAPLDSSRYIVASYSVPFLGVVLHGYMDFAGAPLNMEGDVNYAKLKAIENGASIYFTLSYQNTQNLKEDYYLSQYYSVRYDIWQDDIVEIYGELNAQLKDVQNMPIVDHEFLSGMRVPDTDELDRDLKAEFDSVMDFQTNQQAFLDQMKADSVADAREQITALGNEVKTRIATALTNYRGQAGVAIKFVRSGKIFTETFADYMQVKLAYDATMAAEPSAEEAAKAEEQLNTAKENVMRSVKTVASKLAQIDKNINEIETLMVAAKEGAELIDKTEGRPQSIVDEVYELIAEAEEFRKEIMGTTLEYSASNLELQTFLHLHFAVAKYYTGVEMDAICEMETIYNLFSDDAYGLYYEELEFLKILPTNSDKDDAYLIDRYNLKKGEPSMEGLALYVRDILGDGFAFDPALVATDSVDDSILSYFKNIFSSSATADYKKVTATDDRGIFAQYFEANPERYSAVTGGMIPNTQYIEPVFKAIVEEIKVLTDKQEGLINKVEDGNYTITAVMPEAELNALVDKIVSILEANDKNTDTKTPIEFYAPENHAKNARNYIYTYYYYTVMSNIVSKDAADAKLPLLTVESQTNTSINLLAQHFVSYSADAVKYDVFFELFENYKADADDVKAALGQINDQIKGVYGDQFPVLEEAYLNAYAAIVAKLDKTNASLAGDKKEGVDSAINTAAANLIGKKYADVTSIDDLNALIDEIVALHENYETDADYDVEKASAAYVFFNYFTYISDQKKTVASFYYNETLATIDASVLGKVEENSSEIRETVKDQLAILAKPDPVVPSGASKEEKEKIDAEKKALAAEKAVARMICLEAVFASLADENDPIDDFVDELAAAVGYPTEKGNIADDIQKHYNHMIFADLDVANLGKLNDLPLTVDKGDADDARDVAKKYIAERISDMIKDAKATANGGPVNYTLSAFMTEEEINKLADDVIDQRLVKNEFINANPDYEKLRPDVINIIKYCFYDEVIDTLKVEKAVDFNFYEVYGDSVEESAGHVRDIIDFYVLGFTNITEKELENLFKVSSGLIEEDEESETSRYLSDDGRIVSVSYGQAKAEGGYTKYKTFVLNYNNFSVNVVYEDVTYTIPAYGYVVVTYDAAAQ